MNSLHVGTCTKINPTYGEFSCILQVMWESSGELGNIMSSNRRTARLQERLLLGEPTVFTQGQWELVRNNVDKWELYCQFNGHRNWWVMVDAFLWDLWIQNVRMMY